jgi:hypothetical protein
MLATMALFDELFQTRNHRQDAFRYRAAAKPASMTGEGDLSCERRGWSEPRSAQKECVVGPEHVTRG